jgi:hypothetical protein
MPPGPVSHSIARLERELSKIGCPDLIALDGPASADHLNYLDLMGGRIHSMLRPRAVAEFQGRPVLYVIDDLDQDAHSTDAQVRDLGQILANRSEHAVLEQGAQRHAHQSVSGKLRRPAIGGSRSKAERFSTRSRSPTAAGDLLVRHIERLRHTFPANHHSPTHLLPLCSA